MKKFFQIAYIALILLFIYAPIFTLVLYSFVDSPIVSIEEAFRIGFSLELYKKLFNDAALMTIVWDTLILALVAAILATILGTIGAIGIYYSRGKLGKGVSAASRIPVINAEIVTAVALVLLFALIFTESRSYFSMLIGHLVITTPFVVLSVMPKLKQMDPNMYEAALDLGASPFGALVKVVIPEILPG
ncbi:MAG: ABC transporter permease, partial [Clostridia bacterium]|nr:ABC transporter permease [Clostridia bacterium]